MWINKEIIPLLIKAVKITLKEEIKIYEQRSIDANSHYGPNDLVILEQSVLPVLEDNINNGFDSSQMLGKGFGLLTGLLPWYLNTYKNELSEEQFGKLACIHFDFQIHNTKTYIHHINPGQIKENIERINQYIELIKL